MSDIKELTEKIKRFRDRRNWMQYHNHKDMAVSLAIEVGEVLEHFQWKSPEEVIAYAKTHADEIGEELADIAIYLFELADNLGVDLASAVDKKILKNEGRFPENPA